MGKRTSDIIRDRISSAWGGRVSGCMLGKPVEMLSIKHGVTRLQRYLVDVNAMPLREYIPFRLDVDDAVEHAGACIEEMSHSIPDDDINYTVLSLLLVEEFGHKFTTADVGRMWLRYLPGSMVFTAEREAYVKLLAEAGMRFPTGADSAVNIAECSDNQFNDWIGAQIRVDLYGWINPGDPSAAADMARRDAELSHRGEGVYGAMVIAAAGASILGGEDPVRALEIAVEQIPANADCATAVEAGLATASSPTPERIRELYGDLSPVHTVNNLALVAWALARNVTDFAGAIGDVVSAGWDTDCNGATVGGLWGLTGEVPKEWGTRWNHCVHTSLSGMGPLTVEDLTDRTLALLA